MRVIRYKFLSAEINRGTEDEPDVEQVFLPKFIPCPNDSVFDENLAIAKREAYNGEYTIEDDGQPEPEPTEQEQLRADVDFLLAMGGVL